MADSPRPSDVPIRDFMTALASADSSNGAVSAAAVAGAMGASLLLKVTALPTTRSDSLDERTALLRAGAALGDVQEQLIEAVETESLVKLFAARNMPQASQTERARRQAAIQLALRAGADVPLEVIRLCALGLNGMRRWSRHRVVVRQEPTWSSASHCFASRQPPRGRIWKHDWAV